QVSVFSGFNQPKDISMSERYEALCGITQEELESYFSEPIVRLAKKYKETTEAMLQHLKRQYDGYHFSTEMTDIYNPFSILNAFDNNHIRDYWFATGTPTYLIRLLQHSNEQMNDLTGRYYDPSMFVDYKADVEQPLPMIYQSGYLTIKAYDMMADSYLLDFPNNEVRKGFLSLLSTSYLKPKRWDVSSWILEAMRLLRQGDTSEFRTSLTAFLASIPYDAHDSLKDLEMTEKHFQYTFYLLLRLMGVYCLAIRCEDRQSFGRVDCTLEMDDYVYIFEFKLDGTAREAMEQIEARGYTKPYIGDKRKVICIGMNFSSETRTVEDWEEKSL
ncbi:MAG: AAA family ATPase, partial [Bacteroidales bacterium]|nr:AAA family ATPase [Bacteroidales bacterium]